MVSQRLSSALGLSEDDAGSEVAKVQLSVLVPEPEQREQKVRAGSAVRGAPCGQTEHVARSAPIAAQACVWRRDGRLGGPGLRVL